MAERGAGQRSWPLSPYDVNVSFARTNAAGEAANWFGPLTPITPLAPPEIAGRQWDYPAGYNLSTLPRAFAPITFWTLRSLADGYDLLRLVIETRKDQAARQSWSIAARDSGARSTTDAARIATLKSFFARPDGIHGFADWLRMLLEEVFVTDAPALYMSRDRGGRLKALMPLDGATIKPVIDPWGRVPQPYLDGDRLVYPAAYQQILKGYPAIDYSVRDLTYRPRNPRVNRVYGMSPVEQVVTTVNIALRRQLYLLDYFAEGIFQTASLGFRKLGRRIRSPPIRNIGTPISMAISAAAGGPNLYPAASRRPSSRQRSRNSRGRSTNGSRASSALLSRFRPRL
ncbi:MAG: hypothetical protein WBW81_13370 [Methylocella sp.]